MADVLPLMPMSMVATPFQPLGTGAHLGHAVGLWPLVAQTQGIDATGLAVRVVVALGLTAGLLIIITHILKRFGYGGASEATVGTPPKEHKNQTNPIRSNIFQSKRRGGDRPPIRVDHILPLTRQAKAAIIVVDGHRLVVGITDQQVNLLKDLGPDTHQPLGHHDDPAGGGAGVHDGPITGELERYPIDPAIIRAAQLRSRQAD